MHKTGASSADRFLALLKPIERDLETYCRRLIWEPQEAPDAIQNSVLRAFAAFDRYREDASFRAWMFKILTNEVLVLNRKHARIARHEFQLAPEELAQLSADDPQDPGIGQLLSTEGLNAVLDPVLTAGLKTLTDTERAVLLLRSVGELRYREIGATLTIPLGSVMGNLARARQKMRGFITRSERRKSLSQEN